MKASEGGFFLARKNPPSLAFMLEFPILWQQATCKVNGINVHYLRTGGNKPPVVLLHGLMTSGACWTPLAQALEEGYDVIMPDARGHGKSSAPAEGYYYDNLATDVLSLIEVLGLATPVLIGHSMGGMTAAVVANRNPKRIRGAYLSRSMLSDSTTSE
jgi:N-formylmaleamate deformylase